MVVNVGILVHTLLLRVCRNGLSPRAEPVAAAAAEEEDAGALYNYANNIIHLTPCNYTFHSQIRFYYQRVVM